MLVYLKSDAPWDEVEALTGEKISKVKPINCNSINILPFFNFVELKFEDTDVFKNSTIDELTTLANENNILVNCPSIEHLAYKLMYNGVTIQVDLSTYTKAQLIKLAQEKGLPYAGLDKTQLIELLKNA